MKRLLLVLVLLAGTAWGNQAGGGNVVVFHRGWRSWFGRVSADGDTVASADQLAAAKEWVVEQSALPVPSDWRDVQPKTERGGGFAVQFDERGIPYTVANGETCWYAMATAHAYRGTIPCDGQWHRISPPWQSCPDSVAARVERSETRIRGIHWQIGVSATLLALWAGVLTLAFLNHTLKNPKEAHKWLGM